MLAEIAEDHEIAGGAQDGAVDRRGSLEDVFELAGSGVDLRNAGQSSSFEGSRTTPQKKK